MAEAALTSKGQVTVPASIRKALGLKEGDRLAFTVMPDGTTVMRAKPRDASSLAGAVPKPAKQVGVAEMKTD